jgi:hypothetical protein
MSQDELEQFHRVRLCQSAHLPAFTPHRALQKPARLSLPPCTTPAEMPQTRISPRSDPSVVILLALSAIATAYAAGPHMLDNNTPKADHQP